MPETLLSFSEVLIFGRVLDDLDYDAKPKKGKGNNKHLDAQFADAGSDKVQFAKIYGFAYEGTYYDLPEPVIFLVHGDGTPVNGANNLPGNLASRAPTEPSVGGVAAADFQIANDIKVWNYDKADQTMRMDVMTGQFEQVLLDIYLFRLRQPGDQRGEGFRCQG